MTLRIISHNSDNFCNKYLFYSIDKYCINISERKITNIQRDEINKLYRKIPNFLLVNSSI